VVVRGRRFILRLCATTLNSLLSRRAASCADRLLIRFQTTGATYKCVYEKGKKRKENPADFNPTFAIFLRIFRDKTDFPLTTRNRIKSSASGGRTIALDRVLSTEVQLIIVKLDRRYFIKRQERGDGRVVSTDH